VYVCQSVTQLDDITFTARRRHVNIVMTMIIRGFTNDSLELFQITTIIM